MIGFSLLGRGKFEVFGFSLKPVEFDIADILDRLFSEGVSNRDLFRQGIDLRVDRTVAILDFTQKMHCFSVSFAR